MSPHHLRYLTWLWPLLACAAGWMTVAERFDDAVHFDAKHVYLPAARAFLEQGWSYLLTPDSYRVVPLAYLWPALWGAEPEGIRIANAGLWAGCVFFLWHTARALGGYRAGAAALDAATSAEALAVAARIGEFASGGSSSLREYRIARGGR